MEVENFIKVLFNWENFLAVWEVVLGEIEIYKYVFNQDRSWKHDFGKQEAYEIVIKGNLIPVS